MSTRPAFDDEVFDVVLSSKDAVNPQLAVPLEDRHFAEKAEIEEENIAIRIGSRPIVRDLGKLYKSTGRSIPQEFQDLFSMYKVLFISHYAGLLREPGRKQVRSVGYEVDLAGSAQVTVLDLFPRTEFIEEAHANIESSLAASAGVRLNGELSSLTPGLEVLSKIMQIPSGSLEAKLELTNKADFVAKFSHKLVTPIVQAIGVGDDHSQWILNRHSKPLVGDFLFSQTLLVRKNLSELKFKSRIAATITTYYLLPEKRRSRWVEFSLDLDAI